MVTLRSRLAFASVLSVIACGCGSQLTPVQGKVTYQGQVLAGAKVSFYAADGPMSSGMTDSSGQFSLVTGSEPGIEPGRYRVTVNKYSQATNTSSQAEIARMKMYQGGSVPAPPQSDLPKQYGDPSESTLEADVTGDPAQDVFVFDLE
ncbi:MAG: carboxypeptidase regulatory-like domain-containing protein [Planctomycetes bacterium]|nr:carboxypeptidase regulatory-like domain-containing protein [Planctomycetota bacterium]